MDAQGKDMARLNELTAWLTRTKEGMTAGFRLSTPDPTVARMGLALLGGSVVGALALGAVLLLTQEPPRQQSADPALPDDDGSQQRLEPPG